MGAGREACPAELHRDRSSGASEQPEAALYSASFREFTFEGVGVHMQEEEEEQENRGVSLLKIISVSIPALGLAGELVFQAAPSWLEASAPPRGSHVVHGRLVLLAHH